MAIIRELQLWCLGPLNGTNERSPQIRAAQSVSPSQLESKSGSSVSTCVCVFRMNSGHRCFRGWGEETRQSAQAPKHSGASSWSTSFTASILALKLITERSAWIVLETRQLAFPGEFHPSPRMQSLSFHLKPSQENHFFHLGTTRAEKPMSTVKRAISSHAEEWLAPHNWWGGREWLEGQKEPESLHESPRTWYELSETSLGETGPEGSWRGAEPIEFYGYWSLYTGPWEWLARPYLRNWGLHTVG